VTFWVWSQMIHYVILFFLPASIHLAPRTTNVCPAPTSRFVPTKS
jgi:hypothetical protein